MSWGRGGRREMKFERRNTKIGGEKRRGVERKGKPLLYKERARERRGAAVLRACRAEGVVSQGER
jgi:hypothetical protein